MARGVSGRARPSRASSRGCPPGNRVRMAAIRSHTSGRASSAPDRDGAFAHAGPGGARRGARGSAAHSERDRATDDERGCLGERGNDVRRASARGGWAAPDASHVRRAHQPGWSATLRRASRRSWRARCARATIRQRCSSNSV